MITNKLAIFFLLLLFFGSGPELFGQDDLKVSIDSILQTIPKQEMEAQKESYHDINNIIGRKGGNRAIELYNHVFSQDSTDIGRLVLYQKYGNYLSRQGDTDGALEVKLKGLDLAKKLSDKRAEITFNIAVSNAHLYQNQPDKALVYLNAAEIEATKDEYKDLLWNVYYHRGLMQNILGDIDGNRMYYEKMYDAFEGYDNTPTKRFALYIIVDFYSQLDYPEELSKYTEILADLYEEANPNTPQGHMPIKSIFEKRADPQNIPQLLKAIRISDSLNSMNSLAYSSIALANTYVKMGQPEKAVMYLEKAADKVKTGKKPQLLLDLYVKLASSSFAASDFKKAYQYKTEESQLRDSVTSTRMQRNIAELEVKFDTEKKEHEIAEQKLVIEKKSRQKNQILIASVGLGLLLLSTFIFFRKRLKDQRIIAGQKEEIQQNEITELHQKNKLLALNSMIEGQEAERLRIAKDLHDSLGGLLSTVKAHFTTIQKEIEQLEKLNITEKTNVLIDEACLEVRRISHNMMPHALSISGLQGAIGDITENLKEQGFDATLEIMNLPEQLDTTREVMIFRLVQEIVSNIRKHANAKSILIQLIGHKDEINLIIEDDGTGFIYDEAVAKGGLGLKSIDSRVEFLDGKISWDSQPGHGTSVTINIPIK